MSGHRTLVLGGARSGKSRYAEGLLGDAAVRYVATAERRPGDAEWAQQIARHRRRRPDGWRTIETADVAGVLGDGGDGPVLVDSVTAWLARLIDDHGHFADGTPALLDALVGAWAATPARVVAVSDEVGSGIVPATVSGRRFRDALGELNQRLAATADEAYLVVAGLGVRLR